MPSIEPTTRKTITLADSLWDEIDAYRRAEHITTEVEAVRRLLVAGLRAEEERDALRLRSVKPRDVPAKSGDGSRTRKP